jgi:hypothetical protein
VVAAFGPASDVDDDVDALSAAHNYLAAMERADDAKARAQQSSNPVASAVDYLYRR